MAARVRAATAASLFASGELFTHYADWLIASCSERIFPCNSGGIPHRHCMDTLLAIKQAEV